MLAAGNSLVLKPEETASLTLLRIAGLAPEAGIPPGVFSVVTGVRQSGNGHDKSPYAQDKFLDLKTAWIQL